MAYSDLLKHPKWQKKRLLILDRDNWQCKACGSKEKSLHVHHYTYQKGKKPWEYDDENFITLCEICHSEEESFIRNENNYFITLSRVHKMSIVRLSILCQAMTFLYNNDRKQYAKVINRINDLLDKHCDEYDNFINKLK